MVGPGNCGRRVPTMSVSDRATVPATPPPSLAAVGDRAEARIHTLLDRGARSAGATIDGALQSALDALRDLVGAGGKRLRPAFCHWAFVGAGGDPDDQIAIDAGAALELLHSFALVHDDIMDGSDRRRGQPAVHRAFINQHEAAGWRGQARRFGEGAAILVGDFAFVYADVLMAGVSDEARAVFDELRIELCVGQFLDLSATATGGRDAGPGPDDRVVQVRQVHGRASAASRRRARGTARRPAGTAQRVRAPARRGVPDARRPARRVRHRGHHRQAGRRRPARRQAHAAACRRCGPGRRRRARRLLERVGSTDLGADEIARSVRPARRHRRGRRRSRRASSGWWSRA